jgi:dihydroorotase
MITKTKASKAVYVNGAHIVDPAQKLNKPADLLVENGLVVAVGKEGELKARAKGLSAETIEGKGLFLAPGFVDLNCAIHEPGGEHVESFASGSRAAAAGGFTTLLVKPVTDPVHDNAFITDFILRRAKENSLVRIVPMGALTAGREGKRLAEIGAMAAAGVRAVGDGISVADSYLMRKGLEYSRAFSLPVFSFPEDHALAGKGVMNEGWNSNRLGLRGMPSAAEEIAVSRDLVLARHTKGVLHLQPLTTTGSLAALRHAKSQGVKVTAETSPQFFMLTSDAIATYDANFKCFPPLRSEEDRDAVIEALADGTLDVVASGHSPQSRSSKEQAFENAAPGMIGLESTMHLLLSLVRSKKISPLRMVELLSWAPAKILGLEDEIGSLKPGSKGDFVLFDPRQDFLYQESSLKGASRNSPFLGQKLAGVIHGTYVGGVCVHERKKEKR